eukprot:TRINITY_DN5933_c0_g1_i1.p1 TRINITY_DN5933_c0_g1~~TRINITY_DN5933_c0_g1_i1.p1  ORF type:complete len:155 (-),score=21.72 TRINITY_DN5933_c0_g1_i1:155-619(-)
MRGFEVFEEFDEIEDFFELPQPHKIVISTAAPNRKKSNEERIRDACKLIKYGKEDQVCEGAEDMELLSEHSEYSEFCDFIMIIALLKLGHYRETRMKITEKLNFDPNNPRYLRLQEKMRMIVEWKGKRSLLVILGISTGIIAWIVKNWMAKRNR